MSISSGKTVLAYLTKKPDLQASKELLDLVCILCHMDKESFVGMFELWPFRWASSLKERSVDTTTRKTRYTQPVA